MAERQAKFEERWRRRRFFEALPLVGAYIRRATATGSDGDTPMQLGAADGARLGGAEQPAAAAAGGAPVGAKRSCVRRASTSAAAEEEAHGKRCAGGGGSTRPTAAVAVGGARGSEPYAVRTCDVYGVDHVQWYGCCSSCGRAHVPVWDVGTDPARRSWACEECRSSCLVWR